MKNFIQGLSLAAVLPLLTAFAPAPDNCGGCKDVSPPISSNGPIYGGIDPYGSGYGYAITVMSAVTPTNGICALQALDPPWSHVSVCQEAFPCTPRVTITVEAELASQLSNLYFEVEGGTICASSVSYSDSSNTFANLFVAPLFDERVRNHCGNLDCPIDITAEIEIADYEVGVVTPIFEWEETLRILGSLACTSCEMVPIPPQVGAGD